MTYDSRTREARNDPQESFCRVIIFYRHQQRNDKRAEERLRRNLSSALLLSEIFVCVFKQSDGILPSFIGSGSSQNDG